MSGFNFSTVSLKLSFFPFIPLQFAYIILKLWVFFLFLLVFRLFLLLLLWLIFWTLLILSVGLLHSLFGPLLFLLPENFVSAVCLFLHLLSVGVYFHAQFHFPWWALLAHFVLVCYFLPLFSPVWGSFLSYVSIITHISSHAISFLIIFTWSIY